MEAALIILKQLITMAIYCGIGFVLHKTKLVSSEGAKAYSKLLLYAILPCAIVYSFLRPATAETTKELLLCIGATLVLLSVAMVVSRFFLKNGIDIFAASFSNAGFMGIPLVIMCLGSDAVFYCAAMIAMLNILQWTYGQHLLDPSKKNRLKDVLINPLVIALGIGLLLYALPITLPTLLTNAISSVTNCNSPVAMVILGFYMAEVPIQQIVLFKPAYRVSFLRLLLIPVLSVLTLALLPGISSVAKTALLIAACAPVGSNVAVYAQLLGKDYRRAVILICQSTIFCVITMPLIILLSEKLIG